METHAADPYVPTCRLPSEQPTLQVFENAGAFRATAASLVQTAVGRADEVRHLWSSLSKQFGQT
jgi:hypothetical protein